MPRRNLPNHKRRPKKNKHKRKAATTREYNRRLYVEPARRTA